jgi:hypothetical protein
MKSFLESGKYTLGPVAWREDHYGSYWIARFYDAKTEKPGGYTGSFYDILVDDTGHGARLPMKEQVTELANMKNLMIVNAITGVLQSAAEALSDLGIDPRCH